MSGTEFKSMPTVARLMDMFLELEGRVAESSQITDLVLEELQLRIIFLMQTIRITRQLHGGIAGPDGKVPSETKTAYQVYMEVGRDKLVAERQKAYDDAARLQAEQAAAPASAGETSGDTTEASRAVARARLTH